MGSIVKVKVQKSRSFHGKLALWFAIFAAVVSLGHIWFNSYGLIVIVKKNALHLALLMGMGFLMRPFSERSPQDAPSWVDWILCFLSIGAGIYFVAIYGRLVESAFRPITADYIYGLIFMLLLIEASRRFVGNVITILAVAFLAYTYLGPYFPDVLAHQGFTITRIITRMTMTDEGILGVATMVSSSYIFMFILFSSFLTKTKASEFFNDLASAIAGSRRGGPAKVAIFASALTGTISGSSQANVVTTGSFTIPLMKDIGYKPYFAGAVEAVASTGGILMPPIMGAAAFIMCSFLGMPYKTIMYAAFPAAFLYYFTIYVMIDLGALKWGLLGLPREQLPSLKRVLLERGHMLIPLILIIVILLIGFSPLMAAFFGIISLLVVSSFRKNTRMSFKEVFEALSEGAVNAVEIATIFGIVGFIIGAVGMTGIGQVIGQNIVSLSGNHLYLALILCMVTAIILGMGLPGPACYMITVTIAAPALIMMGVDRLASHFFVFYFGTLSAVIPPVALTSYTAAAIARCSPTRVALTGLMLASAGLLLPYMFVYNPEILLIHFQWKVFIFSIVSLAIGLYCSSVAIMGVLRIPLNVVERILFMGTAVLLISPLVMTRVTGIALSIVMVTFHVLKSKRKVAQ